MTSAPAPRAVRPGLAAEPSQTRQRSPHGGAAAGARSSKSVRHSSGRWKLTIWVPNCTCTREGFSVTSSPSAAVERDHGLAVLHRQGDVVESHDGTGLRRAGRLSRHARSGTASCS